MYPDFIPECIPSADTVPTETKFTGQSDQSLQDTNKQLLLLIWRYLFLFIYF